MSPSHGSHPAFAAKTSAVQAALQHSSQTDEGLLSSDNVLDNKVMDCQMGFHYITSIASLQQRRGPSIEEEERQQRCHFKAHSNVRLFLFPFASLASRFTACP